MVAHPDDEILWFSSILDQCKRVVVCFGPSATSTESWDSGRARLIENYPLDKVTFLKVRQSGSFDTADWNNPRESESGLRLRGPASEAYVGNADELARVLESEIAHEDLVFTHNPWGEYGHEEHVQVFRVLARLQKRLDFELFVDSYVSNRSATLMTRSLHLIAGAPATHETDRTLARRLKRLYIDHDCWTYEDDFEWPAYESFYRVQQSCQPTEKPSASVPLNVIGRQYDLSPFRKAVKGLLPESVKTLVRKAVR